MDNSATLLLAFVDPNKSCLLLLDENLACAAEIFNGNNSSKLSLLSNRYDIANDLSAQNCLFNDWNLSVFEQKFDRIIFHISKEKAVNHRILNQLNTSLHVGGEIIFAGQKSHGIKSYGQNLKKILGNGDLQKQGNSYVFTACLTENCEISFDDQNYIEQRSISEHPKIYSKPGQFGWNKIDAGSALLIEELKKLELSDSLSILDLGCGYGYLSLMALNLGLDIQTLVATDNNAAAISSARKNLLTEHQSTLSEPINCKVIAANCGENIKPGFDLILCNPPFHQGFDVDNQLGDRFLNQASSLLKSSGQALFVVNSFLGIEKKAASYFKHCNLLHNNKQFKVLQFIR